MSFSTSISILLLSFFASITFNGFFRNIAKKNNILVDIPDKSRKFHFRATPLTGGISIFIASMVTGLLLNGLTGVPLDTNFSEKGFLKDVSFITNEISEKYQVNNQSYDVSMKKNNDSNSVLVDVGATNEPSSSLEVTQNRDGNFEVLLPDGSKETYKYKNGQVTKVATEVIDILTPQKEQLNSVNIDIVTLSMFICGGFIVLFMTIDDLIGIRASIRLLFQALIILLMILMSDEYISNLGNLVGDGNIKLGIFAIPFTIFCVVGLMNAFNMSDGLNGICASYAIVPMIFLMLFGHVKYGLLIPIGALIGFLAYNLGYFGKKRGVFLGDSGSNLIGFLVAMTCVNYSQTELTINPVTALWFVALPLLDCIGVVASRLIKGVMPFRPGRDHLHHKLLDLGLKPKNILYIFVFSSIGLCFVGCIFQILYPSQEYISFYSFICFSILYYTVSKTQLGRNVKSI